MTYSIVCTSYEPSCYESAGGAIQDNGTRVRRCVKPWQVMLRTNKDTILLVNVSIGHISDGASIPRALVHFFQTSPWDSKYIVAYLLHDIAYKKKGFLPRTASNEMLSDLLKQDGMTSFKSELVGISCELFGEKYYTPGEDPTVSIRKVERKEVYA